MLKYKSKCFALIEIIIVTMLLLGMNVSAVEEKSSTTPIQVAISPSLIDLTISDSIEIKTSVNSTTITPFLVTNNNKVGVIKLINLELKEFSPYDVVSFDTDFTKLKIDSNKMSIKYQTHDFINTYTTIESINPEQTLNMLLSAKVSISSVAKTEKLAEFIPTFQFDDSSIDYNIIYNYESGTPASVTNIPYKDYSNYYDEYCIDYGVVDLTDVYKVSQTGLDFGSWELYLDEKPYEKTDHYRDIVINKDMQRAVSAQLYYIGDELITPSFDLLKKTELQQQYKKTDETFRIPVIDRDGYIFEGWYNNPEFSGVPITHIKKGSVSDISLYAKFEILPPKTYTIDIGSYYNSSHSQYESTLPYKYEATSVIFDRGIPDLSGMEYEDVSKNKDGSVIAYIDNNKVVHFVSDGIIALEENAEGMFADWQVTSINFNGNIDTSKAKNMRDMFTSCFILTSLDLSDFNTSNVEIMAGMFYGASSLESLNVSNWDVSKVIDWSYTFEGCPAPKPPWY